jgi:hypothetical protein
MKPWARLVLFLVGVGLFGHLLSSIGVGRLRADAVITGWMIVPIVLLFGVVYVCETGALQLIMSEAPVRPTFAQTFGTFVSGSALNFVTPVVNVGGEPYKAAALAPLLGMRQAAGVMVLHTMLRTLAQLLAWITALLLSLVLLPHTTAITVLQLGGLVAVGGLVGLLLTAHRRGGLGHVLEWLTRIPFLRRLAPRLAPHQATLDAMDAQITGFFHQSPRRFGQALALEYLSRAVFMLEFCLIGLSIGVRVGYLDAFVVGGLESLLSNAFFFVPYEIGTRESAMLLLFQRLGYPGGLGLYAALVDRLRDVLWIAAGLGLIWVRRRQGQLRRYRISDATG